MGSTVDQIVSINIDLQAVGTSLATFDLIGILSDEFTFTDRTKIYNTSDLSGLATDSGGTTSVAYKKALAIANQNPRPAQVVGLRVAIADADHGVALTACRAENNKWRSFVSASTVEADVLKCAEWAQANKSRYCTVSTDSDIINVVEASDTTSIPAVFKDNTYSRAMAFYSGTTQHTDAAFLAKTMTIAPRRFTGAFKQLTGITTDNLTPTQSTNALAKNCNTYEEIGEKNITRWGKVGSGEYFDVIVFADWLEATVQSACFQALIDDMPIDDGGIAIAKNRISAVFEEAKVYGTIGDNTYDDDGNQITGYVVNVPRYQDIPDNDKLNRNLPNITFKCWYRGSFHTIEINGSII